jgi:UDP-N-acetylglucosamine--N-acetylmuramyl-(pentapeptide) pyrophosphoryl-undecaprenol N-acetylglucosamine transferase
MANEKEPRSGSTSHSILLTGGGTGGHLAIVRAVKEALLKRGVRPLYIGSESGQDRGWFGEDDDFSAKLFLSTRGVVNRRGPGKLAALAQTLTAARSARAFMKAHGVNAVLSVGGFSAAPASFAAVAGGVPLFIHEQNAVAGRLNRLLKPFARRYFSSYEGERIDYPVADIFFRTARTRDTLRTVIFLGGSQGAAAINDFALALAPKLAQTGVRILHQAGKRDLERVAGAYEEMGVAAEVFAFDPKLHEKIAAADLAVSRAGASTLWELVANRLPTLFVPYPYAAGDHQYHNARYLAERGAGWVVRQEALTEAAFWGVAKGDLAAVSETLGRLIRPRGAERIAEALCDAAAKG